MTIQKIIGENGTLPQLCASGQCPAAILADNGNVYVQGYALANAEGVTLTAPAGEGFVRMSRETFEKIARQVLGA